jgi:hypothetical protein
VVVVALAALGLAVRGRRRVVLGFLLLLSLGFATGPLWQLAAHLPGFESLRYPSKAIGLAVLVVAILAGRGAQRLARWLTRPWLTAGVLAVVLFELVVVHWSFLQTAPDEFWRPSPLARELAARGVARDGASYAFHWEPLPAKPGEFAYARDLAGALAPATGALSGLPCTNAYLPGYSGRYGEVSLNEKWRWLGKRSWVFGARYLVEPLAGMRPVERARVVVRDDEAGAAVVEFPQALPRAYCAPSAHPLRAELIPLYLKSAAFVAGKEAVVEEGTAAAVAPFDSQASADWVAAQVTTRGEDVEVKADVVQPCVLVLNESLFAGVEASESGRALPVFPVNHVVRGVVLEPGAHTVHFTFRTPGLRAGAAASALALAALAALAWRRPKSQRSRR